jgi:recombination protein RecT
MNAVVETKAPSAIAVVRHQLDGMEDQFRAALPAHMPVERFKRVVMTAIQNNPELMECDRRSLWNAAMKAAQDGLLPDGREGAMVVRKDKKSPTGKSANWQPMIAGIRKKARNSGEIASWDAHVVCEGDHFQFQLGDNPQINHSYDLSTVRGKIVGAYSVCTLKDGTKSYEVMSISDIHAIRDRSDGWKAFKAGWIKSTPWSTDEGEMCRKTVARRHSKVIPMSTDLDDLIRRDDDLYDLKGASDAEVKGPRLSMTAALDQLAGPSLDRNTDDADEAEEQPVRGGTAEQAQAERIDDGSGRVVKDKNPEALGTSSAAGEAVEGEGSGVQPSAAANDFPGDKPMKQTPDFEALLAEFERDAPNATTEEELGELAADLRQAMDKHPPSREFQTKAANAWQDQIDRIKGKGSKAAQKAAGAAEKDPDHQKGYNDAARGASKCLKQDIRDNPERLAKWQAGFDAYKAEGAEG